MQKNRVTGFNVKEYFLQKRTTYFLLFENGNYLKNMPRITS